MKRSIAILVLTFALAACEEPMETQPIEGAYLADRVNGQALPEQICDGDVVDQVLLYESIAIVDDSVYGRRQDLQVGEDYFSQEEIGRYVRTDSTFLLINQAEDTLVLTLLDEEASRLRRIHPCGDTLRYSQARVQG